MEETPAEKIIRLTGSLSSYKAHMTRSFNTVTTLCTTSTNHPSSRAAAKLQDQLDKLDAIWDSAQDVLLSLGEVDGGNFENYEKDAKTMAKQYEEAAENLLKTMSQLNKQPTPQPSQPPATTSDNGSTKPNDVLKPFTLTCEHTPVEFRHWQKKFKAYYQASAMDKRPVSEQHAYFQNCIDIKLEQRIQDKIDEDTPIFDCPNRTLSYMKALQDDFLVRYPLFTRRLDFFRYTQAQGQSFTDFSAILRSKGEEADLHELQPEDIYVFRYICGTSDQELKAKFLKRSSPKKEDLESEARAHESAASSMHAMSSGVNAVKSQSSNQSHRPRSQSRGRNNNEQSSSKPKCYRCGMKNHHTDQCKRTNVYCKHCDLKSHSTEACFSKGKRGRSSNRSRQTSNTENNQASQINVVRYERANGAKPTPRMEVRVEASKAHLCISHPRQNQLPPQLGKREVLCYHQSMYVTSL